MSFHRHVDGPEPIRADEIVRPAHRPRAWRLGTGTLACPRCDAPVALAGAVSPADAVACPFCDHDGAVRDFLSLADPAGPCRRAGRSAVLTPPGSRTRCRTTPPTVPRSSG